MSEINRSTLFGKLGQVPYKAIESATLFCKMRGNPYVELSHWLHQLLQAPDSDLVRLLRHFQLDSARLAKDLTEALDRLPRGATSVSDLSTHVEESVERGWVYATLLFGETEVRSGHLLVGWLKTNHLKNALFAGSDGGGDNWAVIATLVENRKLSGVEILGRVLCRIGQSEASFR